VLLALGCALWAGCSGEGGAGGGRPLRVSGSSTLVPLLEQGVREGLREDGGAAYEFQATGSLVGQRQLAAGSVRVACSDVAMESQYGDGYAETPFAAMPIAVVAHPEVGVDGLTMEALRGLLGGETKNWKALGGRDAAVVGIVRSEFSGIWREVEREVLRGRALGGDRRQAASHADVVRQVRETPGAVGFAAGFHVEEEGVKVLALDGAEPTEANVRTGAYGLRVTGRLIHAASPDAAVRRLADFVEGEAFAGYLRAAGYLPLGHSAGGGGVPSPRPGPPRSGANPWEILGSALAGTGLFLMGMRMISTSLKKMANRRLRSALQKWTSHPLLGAAWGMACGAVSQSGTSSGFLLAGFVASGAMGLRGATYVIAWADVGTTLLVFLAAADVKLLILYFLAVSTLAFSFDKRKKHDAPIAACVGLGLLLFGFELVKSTAGELTGLGWVQTLMEWTSGSTLLLAALGAGLRMATQSSSVVALLSIPLVGAGMLTLNQSFAMVCGTCMGSALAGIVLSGDLRGATRQLILFKALADLLAGAGLLLAVAVDGAGGGSAVLVPLLSRAASTADGRIATFFLAAKMATTLVGLAGGGVLRGWAERLSPPTTQEALAKPRYLHDGALENPEAAIALARLEIRRLLGRLPHYLDAVREEREPSAEGGAGGVSLEELHGASAELGREVGEALSELFAMDVGVEESESLVEAHNGLHAVSEMSETVRELAEHLRAAGGDAHLRKLCASLAEGLHSVLALAAEAEGSEDLRMLGRMTSDKGKAMEGLRNGYLAGEAGMPPESRARLLHLTTLCQRAIWQIHRFCGSLRP
jgi:phosphate:Na+ symporter